MENIWKSYDGADRTTKVFVLIVAGLFTLILACLFGFFCSKQGERAEISQNKEDKINEDLKTIDGNIKKMETALNAANLDINKTKSHTKNIQERMNSTETISKENFDSQANQMVAERKIREEQEKKISEIENKQNNVELTVNETKNGLQNTKKKTEDIQNRLSKLSQQLNNSINSTTKQHIVSKQTEEVLALLDKNNVKDAVDKFRETKSKMTDMAKNYIAKAFCLKIMTQSTKNKSNNFLEKLADCFGNKKSFIEDVMATLKDKNSNLLENIVLQYLSGKRFTYEKRTMPISNDPINKQQYLFK